MLCLQRREETLTYSSLKLMPSGAKLLKNPKSAQPAPVISPKINDNVVPQCSTVYLFITRICWDLSFFSVQISNFSFLSLFYKIEYVDRQ